VRSGFVGFWWGKGIGGFGVRRHACFSELALASTPRWTREK
jgi:hypothetical protein